MKIRFSHVRKIPKKTALLKFVAKITKALPAFRNANEVCIVFVKNPEIRRLNKKFLDHDRTTDVIAFRYDAKNVSIPKKDVPYGDIYICLDTAKKQAKNGPHAYFKELALLLLHGLLHLV